MTDITNTKKIKLMFIVGSLGTGGAERFVANALNLLPRDRFNLSAAFYRPDRSYTIPDDVQSIVLGKFKPWDNIKAGFKFSQWIDKVKPDIIISAWSVPNVFTAETLRWTKHKPIWIARIANDPTKQETGAYGWWARNSYKKAVELEPGFFEALANLGVVLQEQNRLAEAIETYKKVLLIQQDAKIFFNMGTALKNEGKLGDAVESYNQALALNPDYAEVHSNMGEVLRDQGRYDESVASYKKALASDPSLPVANYSLAVYLYDSGDLDGALEHFQRSQFADWQERSLYCLYKTGRFDEFKKGLDSLKAKKHSSPFLATLTGHYADNFGTENDYNFCKKPLDFVFHTEIKELKGDSELRRQLLHDINVADVEEKMQGRLHNGVQSAGNLFKRSEASFQQLGKLVEDAIQRYRETFKGENCEFVKAFPKNTEFASSWFVKMSQGGHLTSHIHEEGWVSGALYLTLPTDKQHEHEGSIELSTHGDDYPKKHDNFPTKTVAPEVGDLVMFPSSVFHRTIPFSSNEERICVAFDLKPK